MNKKILYSGALLLSILGVQAQTKLGEDIYGSNSYDQSGTSVSLSADGSTVVVGAHLCSPYMGHVNPPGNVHWAGQGRVFKMTAAGWEQVGDDIYGSDVDDLLGRATSISADGKIVAFGAPFHDINVGLPSFLPDTGQVKIYQNVSGGWVQLGEDINGKAQQESLGRSISLSSNGNIIAIGAPYSNLYKTESGQVRIYQNLAGVWTQIGNDIGGSESKNSAYDRFGYSISISSDGLIVAIGAPQKTGAKTVFGKVKVYRNVSGTWTQIGDNILADAYGDQFGSSVSLSADGSTVVVGIPGNKDIPGKAKVFKNIEGVWTQIGIDIDGVYMGDQFGCSTSISSDGAIVAIGSSSAGATRLFRYRNGNWELFGNVFGDGASGASISLSTEGSKIAIGAPLNSSQYEMAGKVNVYDFSPTLSSDQFVMERTSVYPNPVSNDLYIKLNDDLNLKEVNVYSVHGQLVKTVNTNQINVSSMQKGFYLVQVVTDKGTSTQKILVD